MSTKNKIDLLIEMNTELKTQNKTLHHQLQSQQKQIDELVKLNAEILVNTNKMGKHIDFINNAYEKITKSYFFKNLLG